MPVLNNSSNIYYGTSQAAKAMLGRALVWAMPEEVDWPVIGATTSQGPFNDLTGTTTGITTREEGSTILIAVMTEYGTSIEVTDNYGNSYTKIGSQKFFDPIYLTVYACVEATGGTNHTFTATNSNTNTFAEIMVAEVYGPDIYAPEIQAITQNRSDMPLELSSPTTAENNQLIVDFVEYYHSGTANAVDSNGFTKVLEQSNGSNRIGGGIFTKVAYVPGVYDTSISDLNGQISAGLQMMLAVKKGSLYNPTEIKVRQIATGRSTTDSITLNLSNVKQGSTLILVVAPAVLGTDGPTVNVSGDMTATLTVKADALASASGVGGKGQILHEFNVDAGNKTIVVDLDGYDCYWSCALFEASGLLGEVDVTISSGSGSGTEISTGESDETQDDEELVVALAMQVSNSANTNFSVPAGYTTIHEEKEGNLYAAMHSAYKITTVKGTQQADWSSNYSAEWNAVLATFKRSSAFTPISATGGTITEVGGYRIHTFTTGGDFVVFDIGSVGQIEYLIVGGGASGASSTAGSGGGGAGGLLTGVMDISATTYPVVVGVGGAGTTANNQNGNSGTDSSALGFTAFGGGRAGRSNIGGAAGGSGGGGGPGTLSSNTAGGSGTPGQGYEGGDGIASSVTANRMGAGGGGAGGPGEDNTVDHGGNGGIGVSSDITGTSVIYAGGGGGSTTLSGSKIAGLGGSGVGGRGSDNTIGAAGDGTTPGSGGGGGRGSTANRSGSGADGIVVIRYQITNPFA